MAKTRKRSRRESGPYFVAAFFCETTIEDKRDGSISVIRMVDSVNVQIPASAPENVPSETHRIPISIAGLVSFKSGDSPGEHKVRLDMESPKGKFVTARESMLNFTELPYGGMNIRLNFSFEIQSAGLFWLHVYLDDEWMTRVPLQITVERVELPQIQPTNGQSS